MSSRLLRFDWDVIAGVLAAVIAIVLHLLHVVEAEVLQTITVVLLAVLLFRDLRRESQVDRVAKMSEKTEATVSSIRSSLAPPDVLLIGPRRLRAESERFARSVRGEMIWFNVCLLMFRPQELFDAMLRPAIENPLVTSIQFIVNPSEAERWASEVKPKIAACSGTDKVREPIWCPIDEAVSFILAETAADGRTEALLSFWGEPFMARSAAADVPRYVFRVQGHSELVSRLSEMERGFRMRRAR